MYRRDNVPKISSVVLPSKHRFATMLQRALEHIAACRLLIEAFYALVARVAHLPRIETFVRDGISYQVTTGPMPHVLYNIHLLAERVYCLVSMLDEANDLFATLLRVQVQQNNTQRLFARLRANSDGWDVFMLSRFITTMNHPLDQYQFIAASLEEQTTFLQTNCSLLAEHLNTVFALLAPPWTNDPLATCRVAEGVLADIERITALIGSQDLARCALRDSVRRMAAGFAKHRSNN